MQMFLFISLLYKQILPLYNFQTFHYNYQFLIPPSKATQIKQYIELGFFNMVDDASPELTVKDAFT